jgi:hypothetical protein
LCYRARMAANTAQPRRDGPENRRHIRIPSILPVDYQLQDPTGAKLGPEVRTAFTNDLSAGGMRLRLTTVPAAVTTQLASGQPLDVVVDLPLPRRRLRVSGKVVWRGGSTDGVSSWLLGVQFKDVAPADAEAIVAYARKAARKPLILRTTLVALAALLLVGGFVYSWQTGLLRRRVETTQHALVQSEREAFLVSGKLRSSEVDLTTLAEEVRAIANLLDERAGRKPLETTPGLTPLEQIRLDLARVRAAAITPQAPKPSP